MCTPIRARHDKTLARQLPDTAHGCVTEAVVCEACAVRLLQPRRGCCRVRRRAWPPGDARRSAAMPAPSPQSSGRTLHAHTALVASHKSKQRAGQSHSWSGTHATLSTCMSLKVQRSSITCLHIPAHLHVPWGL